MSGLLFFIFASLAWLFGVAIGAFCLIQMLIIIRFSIPATISLNRQKVLGSYKPLVSDLLSLSILIGLFGLSYWLVQQYFSQYFPVFVVGLVFSFILGFSQSGPNTKNIEDYRRNCKKYFTRKDPKSSKSPEWQDVVGEYGKALEDAAKQGSVFPESMLPYNREAIKKSLIEAMVFVGQKDPLMMKQVEGAYISLASFVPDADADICLKSERIMRELSELKPENSSQKERCGKLLKELDELKRTTHVRASIVALIHQHERELELFKSGGQQ